MNEYESLNHTKWKGQYQVVFIAKYRRKALYGSLRQHLGGLFRELARQKECATGEGHLMLDHVHMLISIPPKYSVSQVVGYIRGKSAIPIARTYGGKRRNFVGPRDVSPRCKARERQTPAPPATSSFTKPHPSEVPARARAIRRSWNKEIPRRPAARCGASDVADDPAPMAPRP